LASKSVCSFWSSSSCLRHIVCVCVCVCVCLCVRACIDVRVRLDVCINVYRRRVYQCIPRYPRMDFCRCVRCTLHSRMHGYVRCTYALCTNVCIHGCTVYARVCVCVCTHDARMLSRMYTKCTHKSKYACAHKHTHTRVHTHTHTYTHTWEHCDMDANKTDERPPS